eukprot:gnl/TRDRNA2_/TRDRNA2_37577_c0_seq1.p1 gnl/TRDRNA2_/TRDRNA2_37577_c0~~gnl/TRDRNA2_/TRDRNA2_37577_c0_seq1.p1  ORF type:complete len:422 (+),score=97.56 gnl/TRDRNA2_/TRDRNA2_37577_c0_seq1:78-1343(+)
MSLFTSIYSKTAEERKEDAERAALQASAINSKSTMPEPEELEAVAKLREQFKTQLDERKAKGTYFEFYFGDVNMTRIYRGNDCNLEMAAKWLTRCLDTMDAKADEWAKSAKEMVDSGKVVSGDVLVDFFGLNAETYKSLNFRYPAKRAENGDFVWYVPTADFDKNALLKLDEKGWENFADAWKRLSVYQTAVVDAESKKAGRMVKYYVIFDLKHASISGLLNKQYDEKLDKTVSKFVEATAAEQLNQLLSINAPWWLTNMWAAVTKLLPEKLTAKIQVCKQEDPELYKTISEDNIRELCATRIGRMAGMTGEPSGTVEVKAGADFEYALSVKQGQTISWKFTCGADLRFGGFAYWTGEEASGDTDEGTGAEIIVPQATVTAADGEVEGEIEMSSDGIVTLRWDSYDTLMGTKKLTYEVKCS